MAKNVYQFVDVERIDPPKKPIMVRKQEFAEIYQPLSQSQTEGQADRCLTAVTRIVSGNVLFTITYHSG